MTCFVNLFLKGGWGGMIFNILTIGPVGIGINGKMFKNIFRLQKNPRKSNFYFFRNEISLQFKVPNNQISLHFGVSDNPISLHFGVPDNQISLHFVVPNNCSGIFLRGAAKQEPGQKFQSPNWGTLGLPPQTEEHYLAVHCTLYTEHCTLYNVELVLPVFVSFPDWITHAFQGGTAKNLSLTESDES